MSQSIVWNGSNFTIPDVGETDWGDNLTDFFVAIPQGALQKSGGTFTLTADVNFGANFGLVSLYYKSRSSNLSTAGILRLAVGDSIGWRNNANSANLLLAVDGSDNLTFNGGTFATTNGTQTFSNKSFDATCFFIATADATKKLGVNLAGATTATTTTLVVSQTANRSITLPDATTILVGRDTTDTLTNKTLTSPTITNPAITGGTLSGATISSSGFTTTDTNFTLQDNSDTTKQAQFNLANISTATTRTYGVPDANVDLVGNITGSWTPVDASGAGLTFGSVSAGYTRLGNMVFAYCSFTYPATGDGSVAVVGGLPFSTAGQQYSRASGFVATSTITAVRFILPDAGVSLFDFRDSSLAQLTNAQLSGGAFRLQIIYPVT